MLTCATCGHQWEESQKDEKKTRDAAKVNEQGPYCGLCRHLEMAHRYAMAHGYKSFKQAVNGWTILSNHMEQE